MPEPLTHPANQTVPRRALAISVASLVVPVAAAFWLPDWTSSGLGMLIWLTALIPAFLLSYYRGLRGVAIALSGGMAVITATQLSVVVFRIAEPDWSLLSHFDYFGLPRHAIWVNPKFSRLVTHFSFRHQLQVPGFYATADLLLA